MNTMQEWIAHLQNPLVLAGFGLFIFGALLRPLFMRSGKLVGKEAAPLLHKAVNFIFILAVLAIVGGLALSWKEKSGNEQAQAELPEQPSASQTAGVKIEQAPSAQIKQETKGQQSPAINAQGDVEINYAK